MGTLAWVIWEVFSQNVLIELSPEWRESHPCKDLREECWKQRKELVQKSWRGTWERFHFEVTSYMNNLWITIFKSRLEGYLSLTNLKDNGSVVKWLWKLGGANDDAFLLNWLFFFLANSIVRWLGSTAGSSLDSEYEVLWRIAFSNDGHSNISHPTCSSYNITLIFTILIVGV